MTLWPTVQYDQLLSVNTLGLAHKTIQFHAIKFVQKYYLMFLWQVGFWLAKKLLLTLQGSRPVYFIRLIGQDILVGKCCHCRINNSSRLITYIVLMQNLFMTSSACWNCPIIQQYNCYCTNIIDYHIFYWNNAEFACVIKT